jgi:glycosyltransferase involved in cell wall biosynthesis
VTASPPWITIITPTLNRGALIGDAIASVLAQGSLQVEHLIMDGGSSDNTLDLLAQYPSLSLYQEPDGGMYDALNHGLQRAQGEIVGFLNSDDRYPPGIMAGICAWFQQDPTLQAVCGGTQFFVVDQAGSERVVKTLPATPVGQLLERVVLGESGFNSWFFRKSALNAAGGFDLKYQSAADSDLLLRLQWQGLRYRPLPLVTYRYRVHAGSFTMGQNHATIARSHREKIEIAETLLAQPWSPAERRQLRFWHSHASLMLAKRSLMMGQVQVALGSLVHGLHYLHPAYPVYLWQQLLHPHKKPAG